MPFLAQNSIEDVAIAHSYGRPKMAIHTPYQKASSDDRKFYPYNNSQTDPIDEIAYKSAVQLILDYAKSLNQINVRHSEKSSQIFTRLVQSLILLGVDISNISVKATPDDSLLIQGKSGSKSYYFDTFFDGEEYSRGYEIIGNLYDNKSLVRSFAGSLDFIMKKISLTEHREVVEA